MVNLSRRGLLVGFGALVAAPAIVKADNLMSVRVWDDRIWTMFYNPRVDRVIFLYDNFCFSLYRTRPKYVPYKIRKQVSRDVNSSGFWTVDAVDIPEFRKNMMGESP